MLQAGISAPRVVSLEDLSHEQKEIEQASLPQGRLDDDFAFPFAQSVFTHVGMNQITIAGGGVRLDGFHEIRLRTLQVIQLQNNSEPPEINSFQLDYIGDHGEFPLLEIQPHVGEFFGQGQQVGDHFKYGSDRSGFRNRQRVPAVFQFPQQQPDQASSLCPQGLAGGRPLPRLNEVQAREDPE